MAPSVEAVLKLSEELRAASWEGAVQDLEDLKKVAAASGQAEEVMPWDVAFWAERLREERFDFTDLHKIGNTLRPEDAPDWLTKINMVTTLLGLILFVLYWFVW